MGFALLFRSVVFESLDLASPSEFCLITKKHPDLNFLDLDILRGTSKMNDG
jgi:hypothetical protein